MNPEAGSPSSRIGEIRHAEDPDVPLAAGRQRRRMIVTNNSEKPVRVSSHYPFWRVNPRLEFDREAAVGFRLDLPSGSSIRWAPGESREVTLVAYAGTSIRHETSGP